MFNQTHFIVCLYCIRSKKFKNMKFFEEFDYILLSIISSMVKSNIEKSFNFFSFFFFSFPSSFQVLNIALMNLGGGRLLLDTWGVL